MEAYKIAVDIIHTLNAHNYLAFFAGGWVRDHVMGHDSSDIDIATDASPEEILKLFPRTILVGISFGVVIVLIDGHKFEVATFRKDSDYPDGRKPQKVEFSTPKEDALRRDFTINGLFYNPLTHEIFDYIEGVPDIKRGMIRTIGDPHERFVEDRLRMIRAFRFASRFGFCIDNETQQAIFENADTLFPSVSIERVWQEFTKMAKFPRFDTALIEMHRLGLLQVIFPQLKETHLNEIKKCVLYFDNFPKNTPTILYLAQLFPLIPKEEMIDISRYLHTSKQEIVQIETYYQAKHLVEKEIEMKGYYHPTDWVRYFSKKDAMLCLEIVIAGFQQEEREHYLDTHRKRAIKFKNHIDRISVKDPVISGKHLLSIGFKPSKALGQLLEEAENYSIIQDTHDPETVINYLKTTSLWQKYSS